MSIIEDAETLRSFQEESKEHLNGIESDLLAIEEAGADIDEELVNKVFRAMHSIKGGAGFLGLETVKQLSHGAENLLNMIRNRQLVPNPLVVNALLDAVDLLNTMIDNPPASNGVDISSQLQLLGQITSGNVSNEAPPAPRKVEEKKITSPMEKTAPSAGVIHSNTLLGKKERYPAGTNIFQLEYDLEHDIYQHHKTLAGIIEELEETGIILESSVPLETAKKPESELELTGPIIFIFSSILERDLLITFIGLPESRIQQLGGDTPAARGIPTSFQPPPSSPSQPAAPPALKPPPPELPTDAPPAPLSKAEKNSGKAATAENSLRVNVKLLDNLMTLAGELVLTRNQLLQTVSSRNQQNLGTVTQRLDMLTSELQEAIMSTRMQPVGNIFNKFKRVVRDMSRSLDKEINLIIEGGDVDLDKTIIEAIGDPLTHLVRNSVDHGIEKPMERVAKGKSSEGTLRLSAFHQGGHVIIEIADDGAGINVERVKEKALAMGAYTQAQLEVMPEKEVAKLIFMPGLSTAREVTDVSGRGVGMDVVNANLSRIGGVFDIDSRLGLGTTISIKLPLTLAIIPSLIVSVENERYAIPQVNMIELVRIPAALVKEKIERIGAALVMRLRGELLPLIHLTEVLDITNRTFIDPQTLDIIPEKRSRLEDRRLSAALQLETDQSLEETAPAPGSSAAMRSGKERRGVYSAYNILVVSAGNFHYGLIVDKLLDSEEIVVKPLGSHLRGCKGYAGATIQGDGRVALILDVVGISTLMHLSAVKQEVIDHRKLADDLRAQDKQSLLIVRNPPKDQFAIPLGLVSRIEKIKRSQLEITGGRRNIQYRGGSLPLFTVDEAAKVGLIDADAIDLFVIVFPLGGKEVGILTSEIVDVIEATLTIDEITHKQPGILGSAIILGQITLLVDLYGIVASVMPEWTTTVKQTLASEKKAANILVVEDSKFFINQLCDFVGEAGYTPFKANDGVEALSILAEQPIDLVLTDIEMPNMDGLQLSEKIRSNKSFSHLPIIAVTSVAGEAAEKRGFAAGINEYLIKLDREQIIKTIREYLGKEVLH